MNQLPPNLHSTSQPTPSDNPRTRLLADLRRINQPEKILKAIDLYTKAHKQHQTNFWTASALVMTSGASVFSLVQGAITTSQECPPGANGSTIRACGLAASSIVAACLGLGGTAASTKLLLSARSDLQNAKRDLDNELEIKLKKHPNATAEVNSSGKELISRFSQLSESDQKILCAHLASQTDEPVGRP